MRKIVVLTMLVLILSSIRFVHAQDTLSASTSGYADILDDWKDQDKVTSSGGYRSAILAILKTLPASDSTMLQGRLDAFSGSASTSTDMERLYVRTCSARRAMRMANYISKFSKVLYSEHPPLGGLYFYDKVPTSGGVSGRGLEMVTMKGYYGSVSHLLSDGEARHPDVSFDGTRAVFSWRGGNSGSSDYHLYEINLNTKVTRPLTSGNSGVFTVDLDPCYLPNGNIVFVSTRYAQHVDCIDDHVVNLMLCNKDGKYMRQIGFDQVATQYPRVLPSGQVIYCRWDYNDKAHSYAHALFTMNPDGTGQREYCNNNSWWPTNILQERPIPGSTKVMAMIGGYHTVEWGKIGIIDVNVGTENGQGITLVAPVRLPKDDNLDTWGSTSGGPYSWRAVDAAVFPKAGAAALDKWGQDPPMFAYPYPFDEKAFLVSYRPASKESSWNGRMGLYFMTVDAARELIVVDTAGSCMGAVPAVARPIPPQLTDKVNYKDSMATFQIMKINVGQSLPGIADGVITRLRVAELYFRPGPAGPGASGPHCGAGDINYGGATYHTPIATTNASWDAKWIVGETPVLSDGSVNVHVPARKPLFFQALNAKGQVVQTMRSWSTLQPGETFSCMGCHESSLNAPPPLTYTPIAMKQPAVNLEPFYGPRRGFTFDKEIQPIFNAKCISCHDGGGNSGGLDLRQGYAYNNLTSHNTCDASSKYVSWFNAEDSPILQPPYRAGSCKSRLDSILDKGHKSVVMTDEEMRKIRCWIDLGVPQWGTYQEAFPGIESNLTYRNAWLAQEKTNIAAFLATVGTVTPFGGRNANGSAQAIFAHVGSVCKSGNLRINLSIPSRTFGQKVSISIYNIKGALVRILEKPLVAGETMLTIDTEVPTTGRYLINFRSAGLEQTIPVLVVR